MITIGYKRANHLTLPPPHGKQVPAIVLTPGENQVDEAAWDEALKLHVVRTLVEEGSIVPGERTAATEAKGVLAELSPAKASRLVSETFDLGTLRAWASVESRPAVSKAIASQIELLTLPSPSTAEEG